MKYLGVLGEESMPLTGHPRASVARPGDLAESQLRIQPDARIKSEHDRLCMGKYIPKRERKAAGAGDADAVHHI